MSKEEYNKREHCIGYFTNFYNYTGKDLNENVFCNSYHKC